MPPVSYRLLNPIDNYLVLSLVWNVGVNLTAVVP